MGNYYYLAASFPPLTLGQKPELSFEELVSGLRINLSDRDWEKTAIFRRYIDLLNIRFLFLEESVDPRGIYTEKELDESLLLKSGFPDYVFDFLAKYESVPDRIRYFPGLIAQFFAIEMPLQEGFLKAYLAFEREWRLVMVALRAKALKRDVARELQFEDFSDPLVAHILAQKDADQYEPPVEYVDLKERYLSCGSDAVEQNLGVLKWRFDRLEQLVDRPLFSIDWVLCYMAQLLLVEEESSLKKDKGKMILEAFVANKDIWKNT